MFVLIFFIYHGDMMIINVTMPFIDSITVLFIAATATIFLMVTTLLGLLIIPDLLLVEQKVGI